MTTARKANSSNLALNLLLAIVFVLVVGPLVVLAFVSVSPPGQVPFTSWSFSLENYRNVFLRSGTPLLVWNTLFYAICSVAMGITLAGVIAWLTERTDLWGRSAVRVAMFSWMAVPPLVFGYGWILTINPGNGALNVALQSLFGLERAPLTPYSMTSLIVISGLSLVPTSYVMISGLLRNMDPSLEDAGFVHGASRWKVLRHISLPILSPGFLSVGMFLFVAMVQTFDLPLILGATARIPVLSTRIYQLAYPEVGLPNYGLSGAFGIFLLLLAILLMLGYFRLTRMGERFRVVTGKGFRPRRARLGWWQIAAVGFLLLYVVTMLLPLLNLLWASLLPYYRVPNLADLGNLSLGAYERVVGDPVNRRALMNTIILVVFVSFGVVALATLVAWFSVRSKGRRARLLDIGAFMPNAIPPIVMAVAFLLISLRSPFYGTIWVIVIGYITVYLAFGSRTMSAAFIQIDDELENAAVISGASWPTVMCRIVVPLVWPQALNAWLWVVAHAARDLTFPLVLLTSSNIVIAAAIYQNLNYPDIAAASALSMLLVGSLMLIVVPIQLFVLPKDE